MKIVSFDVGIKNMAYCVMQIGENTIKIDDWNVINLSIETSGENTASVITCKCPLKKAGAICGKKASYYCPTPNNMPVCEKHGKVDYILPKKEYEMSQLKKKKVNEVSLLYKSLFPNMDGMCLKKDDMLLAIGNYYQSKCLVKIILPKKVNAKDIDLVSIGHAIKTQFDTVTSFSNADIIVIENQISTVASRMKTIQGMVAQYFIMRPTTSAAHIVFVSSSNKLRGLSSHAPETPTSECAEKGGINPNYKQHKSDGVNACMTFMSVNEDLGIWGEHFIKHKKKDDLADCFLQAIWYLSHHKIISYADNLKINSV
jgi:hypothetical protein